MEDFSKGQFDKKIDIGLKKKELEKKYGAYFSQTSNNISPELEGEWLNQIGQFEQQFEKNETTTVWDYLGKPAYRKASEIKSVEISEELNNLMDNMNQQHIVLDTLCHVDERELYRFITEELFLHEIENIRINGMDTCFIYEDFYPNAEYDIRQLYDYFFRMTMAKMENIGGEGYDLLYINTSDYEDANGKNLDKNEVVKSINTFLDSFDYFEFISNEIENISINEDKTDAKLIFKIMYKGCFNNSPEFMDYKGKGYLKLKPSEYGGWDIYHINLPGMKI